MDLKLLEIIYDPEAAAVRVESQVRDISALNGLLGRFVTALSASDRDGSSVRTVLELFAAMELATHYDQEEDRVRLLEEIAGRRAEQAVEKRIQDNFYRIQMDVRYIIERETGMVSQDIHMSTPSGQPEEKKIEVNSEMVDPFQRD